MSLFPWDPWDDKKKLIHISDGSHHVFHIHWVRFLRPGSFNSTPFFGKFGFVVPGAPRWQGANNQVQSPLSHVWCIKYIPILGPGVVQIWQLSSRWISLTILSESPNDMFKFPCGLYYLHITQKKHREISWTNPSCHVISVISCLVFSTISKLGFSAPG